MLTLPAHWSCSRREYQRFHLVGAVTNEVPCALHKTRCYNAATSGYPTMRFALFASLLFAACTVGEVGTINNSNPDAGVDPNNACVDRLVPAGAAHLHTAGGTSNKGQNCIIGGCHQNNQLGTGAPGFQFAGTVYAAGTTNPQAGAIVRVVSGTTVKTAYTDTDGNFFIMAGSLMGAFTATTNVTACPTVTKMVGTLTGGNGAGPGANSCNLCHAVSGGTTTPISL